MHGLPSRITHHAVGYLRPCPHQTECLEAAQMLSLQAKLARMEREGVQQARAPPSVCGIARPAAWRVSNGASEEGRSRLAAGA